MYKSKKIVAIITARGGSKRIPRKNIKPLAGKPLIAYAIRAALDSNYVDRVVVSTDDKTIANVSKKYGAEVPFIRPAHLSTDKARSADTLVHAVACLEGQEHYKPDIVILIQPTSPLVLPEDIDGALEKMFQAGAGSCFSICEISQRPEWMYRINKNKPVLFLKDRSGADKRNQDLPKLYVINGAINIVQRDVLMKKNKIVDGKNSVFIMPRERSVDIDEEADFKMAEALLRQ